MPNDYLIKLDTLNPSVLLKRDSDNEYILSIPDSLIVKEPLRVRFDSRLKNLDIKLIIKIGKNAKATVIERFENKNDQIIIIHSRIFADKGSDLRLVAFQNLTGGSKLTDIREVETKKSSSAHFIDIQLGAKDVKGTLQQVSLDECGSMNSDLLTCARNEQNHRFDITNVYKSKNGKGRISAKGIALDKSRIIINGVISITNKGGGSDAYLRQDSLILGNGASVINTPKLNISTNDAKAGHGASVTNLNDESFFYLTSRGVDPDQAKKMMIKGFAAEILEKLSDLPELQIETERLIG